MRLLKVLNAALLLASGALAEPRIPLEPQDGPQKRALAESPLAYTPAQVSCPQNRPFIRAPLQLSPEESQWLTKRRPVALEALKDLLKRINIAGFDAGAYIDNNKNDIKQLPNIGLAFSGGGLRALTNGAGVLAAFDSRTPGSTAPGHVGGLLQSATYISGLSGGGWLVGSIYTNNFTSVQSILAASAAGTGNLWEFDRSIIEGPKKRSIAIVGVAEYMKGLYDQVQGKRDAGYDASITDYWGRGLSYQLVNDTDGGPAYTWSSVLAQPGFADGQMPAPILVADGRAPGEKAISINTTVFEMSPWEFGSHDPSLFGMAPMKFVGSKFESGSLPPNQSCVVGFDNVGFVMGTSSSLFNAVVAEAFNLKFKGILTAASNALNDLAKKIGDKDDDIADWSPNPFFKWNSKNNPSAGSRKLTLVDGGEDGQNVPLYPHIQPIRAVDVIFAVDSSADSGNGKGWPNGTALIATYERTKNATHQNGTAFPAIPDINTFINLGLNARPTFFGCDSKNQSGPTPIIVYIANHPYSYMSNITTFTSTLKDSVRNDIIQNGYNVGTMGNGTVENEWPVCLGCAILSRSLERTKTTVPSVCQSCFKKHCWNGTRDSRPASFDPPMGGGAARTPDLGVKAPAPGKPKKSAAERRSATEFGMTVLCLSLAFWLVL